METIWCCPVIRVEKLEENEDRSSRCSSRGSGYVQIGPAGVVYEAAIIHVRLTLIPDDAENFIRLRD